LFTVIDTGTLTDVAYVLVNTRFTVVVAVELVEEAILTYTGVDVNEPELLVNVIELANPVVALVETSIPDGAVTVMSELKAAPDTLKDEFEDGVP